MKPVLQKNFTENQGDCFAACLASILELPLESVPNFRAIQSQREFYDMVMEADKWLREHHGKRFICIELYDQSEVSAKGRCLTRQTIMNRLFHANFDDLVILSGESPRPNADGSTKYHCVVGRADCWGFEIVHDPHPDGGGIIGEPYGVKWLVPV